MAFVPLFNNNNVLMKLSFRNVSNISHKSLYKITKSTFNFPFLSSNDHPRTIIYSRLTYNENINIYS